MASDSVGGLDAEQLYGAFSVGLVALRDRQDFLNRINVFPVADGDTGTNIVATLTYALELAHVAASAGETVSSVAEAALVGARGNSGIIFAQFLGGLAEGLGDAPRVSAKRLVEAAAIGSRRGYEAVAEPEEGTILSVMRDWAEALRCEIAVSGSNAELLRRAAPALTESLEGTREMLPELATAGVVDAGHPYSSSSWPASGVSSTAPCPRPRLFVKALGLCWARRSTFTRAEACSSATAPKRSSRARRSTERRCVAGWSPSATA